MSDQNPLDLINRRELVMGAGMLGRCRRLGWGLTPT